MNRDRLHVHKTPKVFPIIVLKDGVMFFKRYVPKKEPVIFRE